VISYRRDDSSAISRTIKDGLDKHFGSSSVFIDIDAIQPGVHFKNKISDSIEKCDAVVVIIGKKWLGKGKAGSHRIDDPEDVVRFEIEIALSKGIRVFPVLVEHATMPKAELFPESIRQIAYLNAVAVNPGIDFDHQLSRLVRSLEKIANTPDEAAHWWKPINALWRGPRLRIVGALAVLFASIPLGLYGFSDAKVWLYQHLSEWHGTPIVPRDLELVLINDQDYYRGPPQGRVPINRTYLANIVKALERSGVALIALDFNMELPDPSIVPALGNLRAVPDEGEVADLVKAILHAAGNGIPIVLTRAIDTDKANNYITRADVYQPFGICLQPRSDGSWYSPGTRSAPIVQIVQDKITCGYIAIAYAKNGTAPRLRVNGNQVLDSFSLAIARALPLPAKHLNLDMRYVSFMPEPIQQQGVQMSAGAVLSCFGSSDASKRPDCLTIGGQLKGHSIIVGGNWSRLGFGEGAKSGRIDDHVTPVGEMNGSWLHVNFVESMLNDRTQTEKPIWLLILLQLGIGFAALVCAARHQSKFAQSIVFLYFLLFVLLLQWLLASWPSTLINCGVTVFSLWLYCLSGFWGAERPAAVWARG
jgi:CHASE2 domain-containing sensor protein